MKWGKPNQKAGKLIFTQWRPRKQTDSCKNVLAQARYLDQPAIAFKDRFWLIGKKAATVCLIAWTSAVFPLVHIFLLLLRRLLQEFMQSQDEMRLQALWKQENTEYRSLLGTGGPTLLAHASAYPRRLCQSSDTLSPRLVHLRPWAKLTVAQLPLQLLATSLKAHRDLVSPGGKVIPKRDLLLFSSPFTFKRYHIRASCWSTGKVFQAFKEKFNHCARAFDAWAAEHKSWICWMQNNAEENLQNLQGDQKLQINVLL